MAKEIEKVFWAQQNNSRCVTYIKECPVFSTMHTCIHFQYFLFKFCEGVLIGNKTDLEGRRKISAQDAKRFAEENGLAYFECSAVSYRI